MRHIVLDTNCLLACIANSSKFHSVWTAFLDEEFVKELEKQKSHHC